MVVPKEAVEEKAAETLEMAPLETTTCPESPSKSCSTSSTTQSKETEAEEGLGAPNYNQTQEEVEEAQEKDKYPAVEPPDRQKMRGHRIPPSAHLWHWDHRNHLQKLWQSHD